MAARELGDEQVGHSRRRFMAALAALAVGRGPWLGVCAQGASDGPYADPEAADKWMQQWMKALGSSAGPLHLGRFADPMYYLLNDIKWTPNSGQNVPAVQVPVGFVSDLASIPRLFWSALRPDGLYTYPAIIHDYLYWEQAGTRDDADLTLQYGMKEFGVGAATIEAIYLAVHFGGAGAWNANRALKKAGEKRVMKRFPDDPTVTWPSWKAQPGVF